MNRTFTLKYGKRSLCLFRAMLKELRGCRQLSKSIAYPCVMALIIIAQTSYAQQMDWVRGIGGAASLSATDLVTDTEGNIYTVGTFDYGMVDFDPGDNEYLILPFEIAAINQKDDVFILKLNSDGNFIWAKKLGGSYRDNGVAVRLDAGGNVLISGNFNTLGTPGGQMDADPNAGTFLLEGRGGFLVRLDSDGNFIDAKHWNGPVNITSMDRDGEGNLYIGGTFTGTVDLDPGTNPADTHFVTSIPGQTSFLLKLDVLGGLSWAKQTASSVAGGAPMPLIKVSPAGNVYVTGNLMGTADFDPGEDVVELTATALFEQYIYKLDTDGNFLWASKVNGQNAPGEWLWVGNMAIDEDENIYSVGAFSQTFDFDPSNETALHTSAINGSSYILKLDSVGSFVWARSLPQSTNEAQWIRVGAGNRSVYISGMFSDSTDVGLGTGDHWLHDVSPNIANAFLLRINAGDASFSWVSQHATENALGASAGWGNIFLNESNNCYVAGTFRTSYTFDLFGNPTSLYATAASASVDVYVQKYSCNSYVDLDTTACLVFSFNNTDYTESGTYEILLTNAADCDSVITLNLTLISFDTIITVQGNGLLAVASGMSYQWLDCDNNMAPIPGATAQLFQPEGSGQYAVLLSSNDCSYTSNCVPYNGTGIGDMGENMQVTLHPNPTGDVLLIELAQPLHQASLRIMDLSGRVLIKQNGLSATQHRVDVSDLASGIYLLELQESGRTYQAKWVKE